MCPHREDQVAAVQPRVAVRVGADLMLQMASRPVDEQPAMN